MLADNVHWRNGFRVTGSELQQIYKERLCTLDLATAQTTLDGPLPVVWRIGWRCTFKVSGRDSQGNLLVVYTAEGPGLSKPYVRKIRHVRQQPLPRSLTRE